MAGKLEFREKLGGILGLAESQDNRVTLEEVEQYFEEDGLSEEQLALVCDYLLSQKVTVAGYEKKAGVITEAAAEPARMSTEEQAYMAEYLAELNASKMEDTRMQHYLLETAKLAQEMYSSEVYIGDMLQEGNVSLILALEKYAGSGDEKEQVMQEVRSAMQLVIESQTEAVRRDKKMVRQVEELDEKIKNLTEEMGRKVSVDEVAEFMEMSEEQIRDVLKLAGEEAPEDEQEDEQ